MTTEGIAARRSGDDVEAPGTATTFEFHGRFRFGIERWAYVEFDVPPGVARISVRTSHDPFSLLGIARNVLDLGIFGPAGHGLGNAEGFRGWSGGARQDFTLSASDATPGYLAGPIEPGRWALALGPVVLNPLGMRWRASVVLEHGEPQPPPPATATPAPGVPPRRGAGWYRGDLHLHTVHSDGRREPGELIADARASGLDFIASTDHNTSAANREWLTTRPGEFPVLPGEEVTTRHGHWLAVGLLPGAWVDWRYGPRDRVFARYAAAVRAGGGLVVAAHPAVPLPGSAWEFGYRDVDALEVWNGTWNVDDEISLRIWHRLLRRGRRVAAVGGSDSHAAHQRVGLPQTVVFAAALAHRELVEGLRLGRSYLAESSGVALELTASCPAGGDDVRAGPGETLAVPPGAPVTVHVAASGVPGARVTVITAAGRVARATVGGSGLGRLRWTATGADSRFIRIEVRHGARGRLAPMIALTNPIWLSSPNSRRRDVAA